MTALVNWSDKQLDLIRRTVARDCTPAEFDMFVHTCRAVRLDPLRRQIYAFVFGKADSDKRQMTIVTSINGYRAIAERTGSYRPGPTQTILDPDLKDPLCNPLGISHAVATVYKHVHGDWHEITEHAYWEEFAPIKEIWENNEPTGRFRLDPKKDNWRRMPRVMIEKCAEAKALRRGWPDDFSAVHTEEEIDRAHSMEMSAWEAAEKAATETRLEAVKANGILVDWMDGKPLQGVPVGQFGDLALSFIQQHMREEQPSVVLAWREKNRHGLNEYWARDKDGALALKQELEKVEASLKAEAAE